jgi:hypothetical protein
MTEVFGSSDPIPACPRLDLWTAVLAAALFVPLFVIRSVGPLDFWWWMSADIGFLVGLGALLDRGYVRALAVDLEEGVGRKVLFGLGSAAALYAVFWVGNVLSRMLFPFAGAGIEGVYGFKAGASPVRIVLLMVLVIGPGEELFWRAFLQRRWMRRWGAARGSIAVAILYALVHAAGGNAMLVLAAAVCGLFWGWLYLKTRSALLVAVSHTLWDLAAFVFLPVH